MHGHIEHWINKTNEINIVLEILRNDGPQPPQLAPLWALCSFYDVFKTKSNRTRVSLELILLQWNRLKFRECLTQFVRFNQPVWSRISNRPYYRSLEWDTYSLWPNKFKLRPWNMFSHFEIQKLTIIAI